MRILVLNGSPRPDGGTVAMVAAFARGARSVGHDVDVLDIARMDIHGCLGCEYCHACGNGSCVQRDDMDKVYPLWDVADTIVIASPIYYGSFSGQMHCLIHRTYADGIPKRCTKMALLLCSGARGVYDNAEGIYHGFLQGYFGAEDCGVFEATTGEATSERMAQRLQEFGERI